MRSLVAFNNVKNDIIYARCDAEFTDKITSMYGPDHHFLDAVLQFFSTVTFAQTKQQENLNNPLESVRLHDGHNVAFHRFDTIDVICIDRCAIEDAIERCVLFEKVAKLHLGPAIHCLRPEDPQLRERLWNRISFFMDSWGDVRGSSDKYTNPDSSYFQEIYEEHFQPSFLFEGVEDLHVNPVLKRQAWEIVSAALDAARGIDSGYCQAMLMSNGKLICTRSTAQGLHNSIDPLDRLLLIFLSHISLPRSPVDIDNYSSAGDLRDMKSHQQTVFIKRKGHPNNYIPYTLTAVSIRPGITLVLQAEIKTAVAPNICGAIQKLSKMNRLLGDTIKRWESAEDGVVPQGEKDKDIALIKETFNKNRGLLEVYNKNIEKDLKGSGDLLKKWNDAVRDWKMVDSKFRQQTCVIRQIEAPLSSLITKLRRIFYVIYCSEGDTTSECNTGAIQSIYQNVSNGLRDSSSFLLVKAQRNFTLGNYLVDFPGMAHFVVINRTTHRVVVPSLAGETGDSSRFCHSIQRTLHRFGRSMFRAGYLSGYMRKRELQYGYTCCFTSREGIRISPPTTKDQWVADRPQFEMQCLQYRKMMEHYFGKQGMGEVRCFEILTVHIGDLPLEFIAESVGRLLNVVTTDFSLGD
eukprot:sb/3462979/